MLFLAFSFALLALRSCYASRAPLCTLSSLSRLTLASGSWQPGALRVQAVRGLRLGFLVSFGNTVPKHLLELFAGLASLASSLAVRCLRTWKAVGGFSLRCSESMSQDTLVIHCFGSPEELFRPCVGCGKPRAATARQCCRRVTFFGKEVCAWLRIACRQSNGHRNKKRRCAISARMITMPAASAAECMAALRRRQNDLMERTGLDNAGATSWAIELGLQICNAPQFSQNVFQAAG